MPNGGLPEKLKRPCGRLRCWTKTFYYENRVKIYWVFNSTKKLF